MTNAFIRLVALATALTAGALASPPPSYQVTAPAPPRTEATQPDQDFIAMILRVHNDERKSLQLPPLAWSKDLAAHAADWAQRLVEIKRPAHSPRAIRPGEGENLWAGSAGQFTPEEMVWGWAAEKAFFQNGPFPNVAAPGAPGIPGHYTQVVWKNTTEVGCAKVTIATWDVLVCRYAPSGNGLGERPY